MVTMLLGGLWHGAGWTFVVWGLLNGLYLAVERLLRWGTAPDRPITRWDGIKLFSTFHAVCFAWIFFRADSWSTALDVLGALGSSPGSIDLNAIVFTAFAGVALFAVDAMQRHTGTHAFTSALPPASAAALIALMIFFALSATGTPPRQFIYFQF
jgi:D-alanyl-lipoteichoic acid acyltransferase DltB (MBOAT superfamily)